MKSFLRTSAAVALLALLPAGVLCAQDAERTRQLAVAFGTMKNTAQMRTETRAEVEQLQKQARAAAAAGDHAAAMKHLLHGIVLMRGQRWTSLRALEAGLTVKLDRAVVEPGQPAEVRVGQIFALDQEPEGTLAATVSLAPIPAEPGVKPQETVLKTADAVQPDWVATPLVIKLTVPEVPDGNYRLSLSVGAAAAEPAANEPPARKTVPLHVERGLAERVAAMKARAAKVEARLKARKNGLLAALPPAQYRIALYDLASAGEIDFTRIPFSEELKEAGAALEALEAGRNPWLERRGDFRMAYRSKLDDTLQPYRLYVPTGYDGKKAYPLIVALHGMGGSENTYFDFYDKGAFKTYAERRGYIVACPKGRGPASMYTGAAAQDVMDVIAEVRRAWKIDGDRIYLTGHSMGGYGTWSLAMAHPEMFAALAPVAAGGDPANMQTIAHIPQLVVHGDNDKTVPVEDSRVMVAAARMLRVEVKYIEVPGGDHISIAARTFKDVFDWFDTHRRKIMPLQ